MIPTIIIACTTFLLVILSILFFPHFKIGKVRLSTYWIISLVGAVILLSFGYAPIKEVWNQLTSSNSINPLKILVLFFSMTLISIILDELGLFKYLASVASKNAKGNQFVLFTVLYILISILTIFTSNDIVILTLTPFICFFTKRSKINPIPYLVMEFAAANTWSLMFVIGNPTNIYLATSYNITFIDYLKVMAVPTLVTGIAEYLLLILLFYKKLKTPLEPNGVIYEVSDKVPVIVGLSILGTCLVFLIISSYISFDMWLISLICASTLLVFMIIYSLFKKDNVTPIKHTFRRLPYELIPFFLSMFVIVVSLNTQGISNKLMEILGNNHSIWIYGYSSFMASNLINNIPMSILYSNICPNIEAVYASIIGSNIGAFLTPIGALAGIMFTGLVNENNVRYTFIDFMKYGVIIAIPVITIALGMTSLFI